MDDVLDELHDRLAAAGIARFTTESDDATRVMCTVIAEHIGHHGRVAVVGALCTALMTCGGRDSEDHVLLCAALAQIDGLGLDHALAGPVLSSGGAGVLRDLLDDPERVSVPVARLMVANGPWALAEAVVRTPALLERDPVAITDHLLERMAEVELTFEEIEPYDDPDAIERLGGDAVWDWTMDLLDLLAAVGDVAVWEMLATRGGPLAQVVLARRDEVPASILHRAEVAGLAPIDDTVIGRLLCDQDALEQEVVAVLAEGWQGTWGDLLTVCGAALGSRLA